VGAGDTRLVLIRHGESQAALDGIVHGHKGCTGLSPLGRRQAEALRDRLLRTGELGAVDAVYTSELARAIETTEILRPALGEVPVVQDCDLCELHPGDEADGRSADELMLDLHHDIYRSVGAGFETLAAMSLRAGACVRRIVHEHAGRTVVIVCHGGVIRAALFALSRGWAVGSGFWLAAEHTSITEFERPREGGPFEWALMRWSDAAHLEGVAVDG